jgi:hypothetical protein
MCYVLLRSTRILCRYCKGYQTAHYKKIEKYPIFSPDPLGHLEGRRVLGGGQLEREGFWKGRHLEVRGTEQSKFAQNKRLHNVETVRC